MSEWHAGEATITFDIPVGTLLGGYADRTKGSTGTHDALEISALTLTCGGRWLHIVAADVVAVDSDLPVDIAHAAGIKVNDLLLCATHTHSGPLGVARRLHSASPLTVDPELRARFVDQMAETLTRASQHIQPVDLATGDARIEGVWTNRTDPAAAGVDRVRTLAATGADGSLVALLVMVPCHPTVLGAWNLEVSADLHGGIRRALRTRLGAAGERATLLTVTGAAGDISTRFARRESSFAEVDRLGDTVAAAVVSGLGDLDLVGDGLRRASASALLPMRERDAEAEARAHEEALAAWKAIEYDEAVHEATKRLVYTRLQGAEILRDMTALPPVSAAIGGWALGNTLALATVPGELFSSCGRLIEQGSAFDPTWVVGYANGYVGYLVDSGAVAAGTYEALASPYGSGAGQVVTETALRVLGELASS
jgi:hypothetical protein